MDADTSKWFSAGISTLVAGITSLIAALLGFSFQRAVKQFDGKVSRDDFDDLVAAHEKLARDHDALETRTAGIEKDIAVAAANGAARDREIEHMRELINWGAGAGTRRPSSTSIHDD